ncbi:serine/threonine kinase-like domain-containing protein STKLD1 isoform X2 [Hypanus sabinus]|uniref:serine/threonine kinase-like domain-containing protein STKLD1 isoform X2 n=1 Tax=Hypanus sabinus TaxID=79690 RepID=UPI0028C4A847|nr:serine/threonine kinase-like domain-containing protein STKLD1 isoform X2 [Hypanus sabinus]
MENYEFLEIVSQDAHGVLKMMKHMKDNTTVLVKMVECMDEAMANKALREAMFLLDLQHENICKYKEIFVAWNKEEAALSVCLVMEYCHVGNLGVVVQEKRQRKEKVREMVIKNFLGQMVDVLVYTQSKNVIHGNLKATSILMMEDLSFVVSDFTIPMFFKDEVKFKIRIKEDQKVSMAPEVLEGRLDTENDIWSTGCIILEMMMCCRMSETEFLQLVQDIKVDGKQLELILEELHMQQRELMELDYVMESLMVCNSLLSGRKKSLLGVLKIPYVGDIDKLVDYMQSEIDVEDVQIEALKYMIYLLHEGKVLMDSAQVTPVLITLLNVHPDCLEIQADVCQIFLKFAVKAMELSVEDDNLFSETVINTVLSVMESQRKCVDLQIVICKILMVLSGSEAAGKLIGRANGIQSILTTLRMYIDYSRICIPCCGAIWSLVTTKKNARTAKLEGALRTVWQVLKNHLQNGDVVESACSALWALSLEETLSDEEFEDITLLLIQAYILHLRKENSVKNICLALSSLIRISELVAFRILVPDEQRDGLSVIMESYHIHQTNAEVVQTICLVFLDMVQYEDVLPDLISQKVDKLLNEIKIKFASNEDIVIIVNSTLLRLQMVDGESEDASRKTSVE